MQTREKRMDAGALGRVALVLAILVPNIVMAQGKSEPRGIFDSAAHVELPSAGRLGPLEVPSPDLLISITRASHKVPKKAQGFFESGDKSENRGRMEEALVSFLDAIRLDPLYWEAHVHVAMIQWKQGRKQSALDALDAALAIDANSEILLTNKAVAHLDLGNPAAAEQAARSALRLQPSSGHAHYLIGLAQLRQGTATSESLDHLARAIGIVPQANKLYTGLAAILSSAK